MIQRLLRGDRWWGGMSCYLFIFLLLTFAMLLCSCSSGSGQPPVTKSPETNPVHMASFDPCTLFSKDDAAQVLGKNLTVQPEIMAPLCRYAPISLGRVPTSTSAAQSNEILVAVGSSNDARAYFKLDRSDAQSQSKTQDIKGVGDSAFTVTLDVGKAIVVSQANTVYSITIIDPQLAAQRMQNALLMLARQAQVVITKGIRTLPAPHPDPCVAINAQDASKILANTAVSWFFTVNDAGVASCDYISSQGSTHRVQVISLTHAGVAKELFLNASTSLGSTNKKTLKGIGDQAFTDGQDSIWILKGSTFFHMSLLGVDPTRNVLIPYTQQALKRF